MTDAKKNGQKVLILATYKHSNYTAVMMDSISSSFSTGRAHTVKGTGQNGKHDEMRRDQQKRQNRKNSVIVATSNGFG